VRVGDGPGDMIHLLGTIGCDTGAEVGYVTGAEVDDEE
jgi:hypothetical protein